MEGAFQSNFVQNNAFQVAIGEAFQNNFVQNDAFQEATEKVFQSNFVQNNAFQVEAIQIKIGRRLKMRLFNRTQFNMATEMKPYRNQATETREVKP